MTRCVHAVGVQAEGDDFGAEFGELHGDGRADAGAAASDQYLLAGVDIVLENHR